jgi:hypothetical protein
MALTTTSGSTINFYSREVNSNRPQLVVGTTASTPAPDPAPDPAPPPPAPAVDANAPDTVIVSGPASSTTATSASFSFTGSDDTTSAGALAFQCSLDGAAFSGCSSIKTHSGLAVGSHTFAVRAVDQAGNVDGAPAQYPWTIIAPLPLPLPLPPPTEGVLFSEDFSVARCALDIWGTASYQACGSPAGWKGDANNSTLYTVSGYGTTKDTRTISNSRQERWFTTSTFSGDVRVRTDVRPSNFNTPSSTDSYSGFTFYARRKTPTSLSDFYGVTPYNLNGNLVVEKLCTGTSIGNGTLAPFEQGSDYKYYKLGNVYDVEYPVFGQWHPYSVTVENLTNGAVRLKTYKGATLLHTVDDTVGLTGCAPITSGAAGFRSDNHSYDIDNFTVERLP